VIYIKEKSHGAANMVASIKQGVITMEIMLDLETMGNGSNSALIAIGAVAFDINGVQSKFYQQVNLQSSIYAGMEMDSSTVLWWLKQSDAARAAFKDNEKAMNIANALIEFSMFCESVKVCGMWGNGAAFDNVLLSNAYRKLKMNQPWKFWNDRCYRTVKNIYQDVEFVRTGTHHNAVDDAESQALHLIEVCKKHGIEL
jgi:exodeoxyribonuclease VIII